MEEILFDHIIVAQELLPTRDAAGKGDIEAMFTLADHIVKGIYTARSGENADFVLDRMFGHEQFADNHKRAWNTYVVKVHTLRLLFQEGKIDYAEYIRESCDYLQMMIASMSGSPRQYWNHRQLVNCINWIAEHEAMLEEEASS